MPQTQVADAVLGSLVTPSLARLATRLGSVNGITDAERDVVRSAAATALQDTLQLRTNRVLLVELHAARLTGRLTAADATARWRQWQELASEPGFWEALSVHYPTLPGRLRRIVEHRCAAAFAFARRFAADRSAVEELVGAGAADGAGLGELVDVEFGAGDSHRGGQTVALVRCSGASFFYKPRSVDVDVALDRFLDGLLDGPDRIRVPAVVARPGYGWAARVEHRYCADDAQLHTFYRNLGHWLAVMRLLGGSDLHSENLIADGPVPVVVDCETLFTPPAPERSSGYGTATDRAGALVGNTVLGTGLLPGRGLGLGWRGIDMSAMGALPGQQPTSRLPVIVDDGTDLARMGYADVPAPTARNHPSPKPVLGRFWEDVVSGFDDLTGRLRRLDAAGRLDLSGFADVPVRVVLRSTECYAELGRMLWHPESLHDEPAARRRAADLLSRQAVNVPGRPDDPAVIDAEVAELLVADVPVFTTTPGDGRMDGPGGTVWGGRRDLVADALDRWRATDVALERLVIRSAMVSAYLNEGWLPDQRRLTPTVIRADDLDRRRRAVAGDILRGVVDSAIRAGEDGTVTWIAAGLAATGWAVLPLTLDMYAGSPGVAVLLAAYAREMAHGRADPVEEVPRLLDEVLHTMRTAERQWVADRERVRTARPESPGGYVGIGSRIWAWQLLGRLGAIDPAEALGRAGALVAEVPDTMTDDTVIDVMHGIAGTIVPLLRLHESTGNPVHRAQALALAVTAGERLVDRATVRDGLAWWTTSPMLPEGIGGFAHGATGVSWALARLAAVTGDARAGEVAAMGFDYEETLYEPESGGWRDLRTPDFSVAAWCHGAGGIGVVAADLARTGFGAADRWRDVLRRAGESCRSQGTGWNHTICHGDLGAWEVMRLALDSGVEPDGVDARGLDAFVLSGLEKYGPVSGFARDVFTPGLLPGLGGVAYQLLRMHPDSDLPSVMLPDPAAP